MFPFIITVILILLTAAWPQAAWAETKTLTLDEAYEIALDHNPVVKSEQAKLGISKAQILTAGARPNPFLYSDNGTAEFTYRLGVQKIFEMAGKRSKRIQVARAKNDVAIQQFEQSLLQLRLDLRTAYVNLYNAQLRQKRYEAIMKTNQALLDLAEKRQQTGDISKLDVMQVKSMVLAFQNEVESNKYQVLIAQNVFISTINVDIDRSTQLEPPPGLPKNFASLESYANAHSKVKESDLRQFALTNRLELKLNAGQLQVAENQRRLFQANRIPDLNLTVGPDWVTQGTNYGLFATGQFEIPILNRQQGPLQENKALSRQLRLEDVTLRNQVELDVQNAYDHLQFAKARLKRYESELLPTSEEIVKMMQMAFRLGKVSVIYAINAHQAYNTTQLSYLQALLDYQKAISDVEQAIGQTR